MSSNVHFDFSGLNELSKKMKAISGTHSYKMSEVLTDNFIRQNSKYATLDEFMKACGIHNAEEFKAFPESEMDKFVQANTHFSSWQEMFKTAGVEHAKKQLGL